MDHRALALGELEADAHGFERQQDVGEDDGRVDLVAPDRLDRHLGGELRRLAHFEKGVLCPDLAVFRQIPARLAHHPYRGAVHRLDVCMLLKTCLLWTLMIS